MVPLNVCSICDPMDRATWSGTPRNVCQELRRRGRLGATFDADVSRRLRRALNHAARCLYGGTDLVRTPVRRYVSALKVARETHRSTTSHTLHAGTLSLPFLVRPRGQHHYLFCDSTWALWSRYATDMHRYSPRMVRVFDRLERRSYAQMDHIFTIGQYVKDNLIDEYGMPGARITPVGTGLGAIQPFLGEKDYAARKILFVAKNRFRDKGGDVVCAGFRQALRSDPELRLTIVGGGNSGAVANLPNTTVLGFVSLEQLQELFQTHSLFVLPALNEPWGLVYLEAMACKMPIVGLNRNAFPELSGYGAYGFGIDEPDAAALGEVLVAAFRDPQRLRVMGEQGQADCLRRYSWKRTVQRMLAVIDEEPAP